MGCYRPAAAAAGVRSYAAREGPARSTAAPRAGEERVHGGGGGEAGVVRLKIVVSRQQLRQMALSMGGGGVTGGDGDSDATLPRATELLLLHVLQGRHVKKMAAASEDRKGQRGPWSPALQSIPEEM